MSEQLLPVRFPWTTATPSSLASSWYAHPACVRGRFLLTARTQFMHNGGIAEFSKIKRKMQSYLPDELFDMVTGNTGEWNEARWRVGLLNCSQIRSGPSPCSFRRCVSLTESSHSNG